MGGSEPTRVNNIDYISISNFSSAIDFGDLVEAKKIWVVEEHGVMV